MSRRKRKQSSKKYSPLSIVISALSLGLFMLISIYGLDETQPASLPDPAPDAELSLIALDVGQGAATLVRTRDKVMLIDSGERGNEAAMDGYLKELGIGKIDIFLLSHPHSDHMGTASYIVDNYDIGEIIMPAIPDEIMPTAKFFTNFLDSVEKSSAKTRIASTGELIDLGGGATAEVLAPVMDDYDNINNLSVALNIRLGDAEFLITGDAESDAERDMLESKARLSCDVLFAGHHGSSTSTSAPFLDVARPKAAVISVGAGNSYGHPHKETMDKLNSSGIGIYRTDVDGSVYLTTDGKTITIKTAGGENSLAA